MSPFRIAIGPYRGSGSGIATYTRHLVNALSAAGNDVLLFGYGVEALRTLIHKNVRLVDFGADPVWLDRLGPHLTYRHVVRAASRFLVRSRNTYDLIHIPYPSAYLKLEAVPTAVTGWSYGSLLNRIQSGLRSFSAMGKVTGALGYASHYFIDSAAYRRADLSVFTTSEADSYWKRLTRRCRYVPCPVQVNGHSDTIVPRDEARVSFLMAERNLESPRNHVTEFLRAVSILPPRDCRRISLVLAGRGSERLVGPIAECRRRGAKVGLYDYLPQPEFLKLLESVQATVQLKEIMEFGGYLTLEAQARAKAVVVAKGAAFSDLVRDKQTGLTVDPCNSSQISIALSTLIEEDATRSTLGENARRFVTQMHSYQAVAAALADTYARLTG